MKQQLIALALLMGLTLNTAYAGDGIKTANDLIKTGVVLAVAPLAVPVIAVKKLIQKKPNEAGSAVAVMPFLPVLGASLIASGLLVNSVSWLPRTASGSSGNSGNTTPKGLCGSIRVNASTCRVHSAYPIKEAEPELSIDEIGLSLR